MMGARTPETRSAVNKRQDNKLEKLLHLVGDLFELTCSAIHFHSETASVSELDDATVRYESMP